MSENEMTFIERWDTQVEANTQLQRLRQPGIGRSYPLFELIGGGLHTRHFYHVASLAGTRTMQIGPPGICVVMRLSDGELVARIDPAELGIAPFEVTEFTVPADEQARRREQVARLRTLYDTIAARYPHEPAGDAGTAFWETLRAVVPPMLWPAYEALAPEFAAWLRG